MKEEQMKNERIKISEGIDFDKKNNENISQRLTKQVSFNFSETEFKKEAKKRKKKIVVENTEETEAEGKTQCIKNCLSFLVHTCSCSNLRLFPRSDLQLYELASVPSFRSCFSSRCW